MHGLSQDDWLPVSFRSPTKVAPPTPDLEKIPHVVFRDEDLITSLHLLYRRIRWQFLRRREGLCSTAPGVSVNAKCRYATMEAEDVRGVCFSDLGTRITELLGGQTR